MEKAQQIQEQILKFKDFWNGLLNERNRVFNGFSAATQSHLKENGQTHGTLEELEARIKKGQQAMYDKSIELKNLGYVLTGNGEGLELWDETKSQTIHGVYGFYTQHETVYEFAARNNALYGKKKK